MEIIYRSFDGLEFSDEETCRTHEQNNPCFVMFDDEGATNNTEMAYVVDIQNDCGAELFVKMCELEDTTSDGIFKGNAAGVYIWDDFSGGYTRISDRVFQAIKTVYRVYERVRRKSRFFFCV